MKNKILVHISEFLLQLINNFFTLSSGNHYKEGVIRNHQDMYLAKSLHGQFMRAIGNEYDHKFQWSWLRQDKETEDFIMAAQEQALTTNILYRIGFINCLCPLFVGYVILVMRQ